MTPRQKPIEPLAPVELRDLIQASGGKSPSGIRNRALVAVMGYAGLRLAEALALKPSDIDLDAGVINVRRGKGSKQRSAPIRAEGLPYLAAWISHRARLGLNGRRKLFCSISQGSMGKPLTQQYTRTMLQRLAERSATEKRVHPHGLRHSYAAHLAQEGAPVHQIRVALGHSSLATTSAYLDSIAPGELLATVRKLDEARVAREKPQEPDAEKIEPPAAEDLREQLAVLQARLDALTG